MTESKVFQTEELLRLGNRLSEVASAYLFEQEESAEETELDRAIEAWRAYVWKVIRV